MAWNPDKYHQFQPQRSAPFEDLLELVIVHPHLQVVDLGCGTGKLTRRLADSLPDSNVVGMDSSPQMLERAQEHARPGLLFELGDQAELDGKWDLIISNAALHWTDHHQQLIPRLFRTLNPGGQLAVQVPSNHRSEAYRTINIVAGRQPFLSVLGGWTRQSPVLALETYADLLYREGAIDIIVFEKVYPHVLENSDAIVDWISGTVLLPYFERLGGMKEEFTVSLRQEMKDILPDEPVFYPFKRTFFSARKVK